MTSAEDEFCFQSISTFQIVQLNYLMHLKESVIYLADDKRHLLLNYIFHVAIRSCFVSDLDFSLCRLKRRERIKSGRKKVEEVKIEEVVTERLRTDAR